MNSLLVFEIASSLEEDFIDCLWNFRLSKASLLSKYGDTGIMNH